MAILDPLLKNMVRSGSLRVIDWHATWIQNTSRGLYQIFQPSCTSCLNPNFIFCGQCEQFSNQARLSESCHLDWFQYAHCKLEKTFCFNDCT